jgi:predicted transposase YdaD
LQRISGDADSCPAARRSDLVRRPMTRCTLRRGGKKGKVASMKKPYDPTTRTLFELGPPAWIRFLRVSMTDPNRARVIDSNLSTVTAEADKVLWVDEPEPWIEHVEFQAGRDADLPDRVRFYSTILGRAHKVPVHSTIVLLRAAADGPELNGTCERRYRNGDVYDWFRYDIVRVWERPVEEILAAGLAVLPLAPVAAVEPEQVPGVLMTISERLVRETSSEQAAILWTATKVLMGLRYSKEQVEEFTRGVSAMILGIRGIEESSVFQDIFTQGEAKGEERGEARGEAKGRVEEARLTILRQGRKKFGQPEEGVRTMVDAIDDIDQLDSLLERILDASSWNELLTLPSSQV